MPHKTVIVALTALSMGLYGCATALPTERCSPRLMARAKPLVDIRAGDDIVEKYAELRRDSGRDKGQIRGLQSCVNAVFNN